MVLNCAQRVFVDNCHMQEKFQLKTPRSKFLDPIHKFTYIGSKTSSKLSLDRELDKQIYGLEQPLHLPALEQMCGKIPD